MKGLIKRLYTGYDGDAAGKLPGTEEFMRQLTKRSGGALWNNGTFGIRLKRGKSSPSVHCTARSGDASWRHMGDGRGIAKGRGVSLKVIQTVVTNADKFGIEMMIDYFTKPFGRAYKCDRDDWKVYDKMTEQGGGSGDWFHFELSPEFAKSKAKVASAFLTVFGPLPV